MSKAYFYFQIFYTCFRYTWADV